MRIKVINPNTSQEMTENIGNIADQYTHADTEITAVSPAKGPLSIESYYDDYLAVPGLVEEIIKDADNYDAFVNACWGDPGLDACREVTDRPVVGIAEGSMYVANMLGANFAVATILPRAEEFITDAVRKAGLMDKCVAVRCTPLTVMDTENTRKAAAEALLDASKKAIEEDGAEAVCLGCAGMGGLDGILEEDLPVPVVDSVGAGAVLAESIVQLGKSTSKVNTYKPPEPKPIKGYPAIYQFGSEETVADD